MSDEFWLPLTGLYNPNLRDLNIRYFGASTGAAAALVAASERRNVITAIVSLGGRLDLAGQEVLNRIHLQHF